jgi:diaminopropionate ammonia-lyase
MRAVVNGAANQAAVPAPGREATAFHRSLAEYAPTPLRALPGLAEELRLGAVLVKDESDRMGLPSFKILGAGWAVERTLRDRPRTRALVAASAGNHGRAVARAAAQRRLGCRVFLPARSLPARRAAIANEGGEVVVVDGSYEDALRQAADAAREPGASLISDVGVGGTAAWVIDGYATLFAEAAEQADYDVIVVPVGVGSLAAAAARHAASRGSKAIGAEPVAAACLTASLVAGVPTAVSTPGTTMAGLDCAEVSPAAWPSLRAGIAGMVTVDDAEVAAAMAELQTIGLTIGESGAAPLAALRALTGEPGARELREAVGIDESTRALLIATEGKTSNAAL